MGDELFERDTGVLRELLNGRASVPLRIIPQERDVLVSNQWDERADLCLYPGDVFELVRATKGEPYVFTPTLTPRFSVPVE